MTQEATYEWEGLVTADTPQDDPEIQDKLDASEELRVSAEHESAILNMENAELQTRVAGLEEKLAGNELTYAMLVKRLMNKIDSLERAHDPYLELTYVILLHSLQASKEGHTGEVKRARVQKAVVIWLRNRLAVVKELKRRKVHEEVLEPLSSVFSVPTQTLCDLVTQLTI
jgi:hypothetical protein